MAIFRCNNLSFPSLFAASVLPDLSHHGYENAGQISSFLRFLARIRNIVTTGMLPSGRLWHGVVAAAAPGVTAQNALERQPETLQRTIFSESLEGVL